MKKIQTVFFILSFFLLLGLKQGYAQNSMALDKSIASLSTYIDSPINEATGIPSINIPILNVPMPDYSVDYPISLRYNVRNYENTFGISDVGQGWSLFGTSLIYREELDNVWECDRINYPSNNQEDIYYYNVLDLSGKLAIKKTAGVYTVVNLTPSNNIKIEVNNSNTNPGIFTPIDFTIITDNGYKYTFTKIDTDQFQCYEYNYPITSRITSSYYLTKIVSPSNVEIASLDYQLQSKTLFGQHIKNYCKIKAIKTSKGEVNFDFVYDDALVSTLNDPYRLNKISLKNPAGEVLYSFLFNTYISSFPSNDQMKRKRILSFIRKNDKNDLKIEQTVFDYENSAQSGQQEGILKKITLPAGGIVEYNYEDHIYPNHIFPVANLAKRIKNVNYYKNSTDTTPERKINYDYNFFGTTSSSGYKYFGDKNEYSDQKNVAYILYKNVKIWETGKGYTQKTFITPNDYPKYLTSQLFVHYYYFWPNYNITRWGLPSKEEIYDEQNTLLSQKDYNYFFGQYQDNQYDFKITPEYSVHISEHISSKIAYILKTNQTEKVFYPNNQSMTKESEVNINALNLKPSYLKSIVNGNIKEKFITYPINLSGYSHLENANIKGVPIITEEKENGKLLSRSKLLFNNGSLLPTSILTTNIADGSTKESLNMNLYDNRDNLIQFSNVLGVPTAMIYGYNQSSLIAKIEGATYNQVQNLAQAIISASNIDNNTGTQASEDALLSALNIFRSNPSLSGFQITTYTYDPLVGVRSTTLPSGVRQYYIYDNAGRLQFIKDKNGYIIEDYQYRYKNY
ncbi:hypothetical protein [Chryseobacterium sp. NKUCC03_KSP]|uniref:hypothetical protein n=1 Tax=Chryseobacterium sp. NKUCC03_KSP TaxID=2842125 RepID=UPI001C5AEA28|nr:hypothetical protein [Chryseobacterium sp. NKUCC03_KSP]MBW3522875.1 hypothetical protein [Chryseobacterium sp. NKUCC03_KSP]